MEHDPTRDTLFGIALHLEANGKPEYAAALRGVYEDVRRLRGDVRLLTDLLREDDAPMPEPARGVLH